MRSERTSRCDERGTAFVLAPAAVLVLLVLGALALDVAVVHAAQRGAYRALSSAVDDAAAMVDERELQTSGTVHLDQAAAERVVRAHLGLMDSTHPGAGEDLPWRVLGAQISTHNDLVTVTATVEVERVFGGAVPGMDRTTTVDISARGRLRT